MEKDLVKQRKNEAIFAKCIRARAFIRYLNIRGDLVEVDTSRETMMFSILSSLAAVRRG